ncbi:WXG100 family type VII secretion target [Tumebacillus flagellatus]|uniref:LXG domain-containing protein n=1 Tax=Tumebacillus flagellatus TaxID=1157490 RepID=A0A074LVN3_9BACL|nr:hypothetical protein [Tumebacillus flagellatus]KEO84595.1 hypothetical protein EL26_03500 [Tumebacillus flagellatus]
MTRISDTYAIRNGAYRFGGASQDFAAKVTRLKGHQTQTMEEWKGTAALRFSAVSDVMFEDLRTAGTIFEKIAGTLNALAGQLDQVNSLIQQSESLQGEIDYLHHCINSTDDPERRASYRSDLHYYLNRRAALVAESQTIEFQANKSAEDSFNDLSGMVENLHCFKSYDEAFNIDWSAPLVGFSKTVANAGGLKDVANGYADYKKGYGAKRYKLKKGTFYEINNPQLKGIEGHGTYTPKSPNYRQAMTVAEPRVVTMQAMKDIKGFGTAMGYASIAVDTGTHLYENIQEGKSTSHIVAEATVDVGVGAVSMAAATYTGAAIGTAIGGPIGTLLGAVGGFAVGYFCSLITDGTYVNGKSIGDHMKDGLEEAIDSVGNLTKCGWDVQSSVYPPGSYMYYQGGY